MNPPQGAGFPPPGPHGQGNQPQARTPAGAYQMMYVPVVQYPGQQQQQWTPHGGGTVPMMMAQGQVMMAVPQGAWGALTHTVRCGTEGPLSEKKSTFPTEYCTQYAPLP